MAAYFWAMTVQPAQQAPGATSLATFSGVIEVDSDATPASLFDDARGYVAHQLRDNGFPGSHNVLFYTLTPNHL